MTMTIQQVREETGRIVEAGDEKALRDFYVKHFKEFPENMQKKVLFAFFEEMVEQQARIAKIQELGLEAAEELEAFKTSLQKA